MESIKTCILYSTDDQYKDTGKIHECIVPMNTSLGLWPQL